MHLLGGLPRLVRAQCLRFAVRTRLPLQGSSGISPFGLAPDSLLIPPVGVITADGAQDIVPIDGVSNAKWAAPFVATSEAKPLRV